MATVQLDVERVRAYMAQQGWSERDLAQQMGVAYSYVNRLLSGKRQVGPRAIAGLALAGCEWQAVLRIVPDSAKQ